MAGIYPVVTFAFAHLLPQRHLSLAALIVGKLLPLTDCPLAGKRPQVPCARPRLDLFNQSGKPQWQPAPFNLATGPVDIMAVCKILKYVLLARMFWIKSSGTCVI